jgi:Resolvase, N terminal domain
LSRTEARSEQFASITRHCIARSTPMRLVADKTPIEGKLQGHARPHLPPSNSVRTIIVESPDRFARDLAVQLAGHDFLKNLGVSLIPATAPDFFLEETPTAVLVRQVLGAIAQFEKASLVAKLKAARDRKIAQGINGGRKSYAERSPDLVAAAKALQAEQPGLSLRKIADRLRSPGGAPGSAVWESRPATCPAGP